MGLRETKKQGQRRAILDTAAELFRERGFDQTRVQDIIEPIEISEKTFFNYFPSKQSVLEALAVDLLDRSLSLLHGPDAATGSVIDRLELVFSAVGQHFIGDQQFAELLAHNAQLWLAGPRLRETFGLLTGLFEEGQQRGEIRRDVRAGQLAELFAATILVTISKWLLAPTGVDGSDMSDELDDEPLELRLKAALRVFQTGAMAAPDTPRPQPRITVGTGRRRPSGR